MTAAVLGGVAADGETGDMLNTAALRDGDQVFDQSLSSTDRKSSESIYGTVRKPEHLLET